MDPRGVVVLCAPNDYVIRRGCYARPVVIGFVPAELAAAHNCCAHQWLMDLQEISKLKECQMVLEGNPHAAPPPVASSRSRGFEFVPKTRVVNALPRTAAALPSQCPASSSSCRRAPFPDRRIETTETSPSPPGCKSSSIPDQRAPSGRSKCPSSRRRSYASLCLVNQGWGVSG